MTIKNGVNQCVRFGIYHRLKRIIMPDGNNELINNKFNSLKLFFIGAFCGGISVYITQPTDVVKTQVMSLHGINDKNGTLYIINNIYINHGIFGFWKGALPRLVRVSAEVGLVMTFYDIIRSFVDQL
mmetsp:Transcript_103778/g.126844  ORF Transcript_103778/g.126844 Transcript_103778/m.126844 type:complete len:127 (+) Transcript_103778:185-565(+)